MEASCIGNACPEQTSFRALIDSGASFTFLPDEVYEKVAKEVIYCCFEQFCVSSLSRSNVAFNYHSLTDMSMLQGLAMKGILGSIAIRTGEFS